jgi:hypothetical protein
MVSRHCGWKLHVYTITQTLSSLLLTHFCVKSSCPIQMDKASSWSTFPSSLFSQPFFPSSNRDTISVKATWLVYVSEGSGPLIRHRPGRHEINTSTSIKHCILRRIPPRVTGTVLRPVCLVHTVRWSHSSELKLLFPLPS